MAHSPIFQNVAFAVEQTGGSIFITPKPPDLRGQFGDVITWIILNNLQDSIVVELDGLDKAMASFNSANHRTTPPIDPGEAAALSDSITAKPKKSVHYTYSVWVTYQGVTYDVDPDLQVDPPSGGLGRGAVRLRRRPKPGKGGARKHAKGKGDKKK